MMKSVKSISANTKCFYIQLFFAVVFSTGTFCYAADLFVDDNICPQTGSGISSNPYCSIQYAITQAVSGDTVYVHVGTYAEGIRMKSGVDLRNISGEQPKIVTSVADNHLLFDGVSNCTIDGFLLDDSSRTTPTGYAIVYFDGYTNGSGNGLAIRNCEITGTQLLPADALARAGIRLNGQLSVEITGNTITRNKRAGITTRKMSANTIYDSTVIIKGNTITDNGQIGIYLRGSGTGNRVIIGGDGGSANTISGNGGYRGSGVWLRFLQGVSIENNDISNSGRVGLMLESVNSVEPHITRNSIHDNFTAGINIGGDSTLTIGANNEIYHNSVAGITFYAGASGIPGSETSSGTVTISDNNIHTNAKAGISIIDHVTGPININGNSIYQNEKAGIAFFNSCTAVIFENDIHDHTGAAGIFTGTWTGVLSPMPLFPPASLSFNRTNGPVQLTISRNKIHNNLSGMRLDHASGTISNNLVYNNTKSGIRFSGNDIVPYEPFNVSWGITELTNNTVVDNGTVTDILDTNGDYLYTARSGSGIVYDDINNLIIHDEFNNPSDRNFFDPPVNNSEQGSRLIQNNIAASNATAGIKDAACTVERDYNLYYLNFGVEVFAPAVIGGCATGTPPNLSGNPNEIFADPLFVDRIEYQLQPGSPAMGSGNDNLDMGAYGGSSPITW